MALDSFENTANASGFIDDETEVTGLTAAVTTVLVEGLSMTKIADKNNWANGYLLYTLTITNSSGSDYNNVTVTDQLGPSESGDVTITLVENSVKLNGNTVAYTYENNLLTVTPNPVLNIADGGNAVITFQVEKA